MHTRIPVWLHFCLIATEDSAVIIGELFARLAANHSSEHAKVVFGTSVVVNSLVLLRVESLFIVLQRLRSSKVCFCTAGCIADQPYYSLLVNNVLFF